VRSSQCQITRVVLQKYEAGKEVVKAMEALRAAGAVPKWGRLEGELQRRTVFLRQLTEARRPWPHVPGTQAHPDPESGFMTVSVRQCERAVHC